MQDAHDRLSRAERHASEVRLRLERVLGRLLDLRGRFEAVVPATPRRMQADESPPGDRSGTMREVIGELGPAVIPDTDESELSFDGRSIALVSEET